MKDKLVIATKGNIGLGTPSTVLDIKYPSLFNVEEFKQFLNKDKAELAVDMVDDNEDIRELAKIIYEKLHQPES